MKTLDKYVAREMMVPFVAGFAVILVLLVGTNVYNMIPLAKDKLHLWPLLLCYVLLQTPSVVVLALPSGALFGCSLAIARLSYDSEITMMRMAGVSVKRIFLPVMAVGALISVVAYAFQEEVTVWAERESSKVFRRLMQTPGAPPIESNIYFKVENYCFYVNSVTHHGGRTELNDVMIYENPIGAGFPTLTTARTATEENHVWVLRNGTVWRVNRDGDPELFGRFPKMKLDLTRPMSQFIAQEQREPKAMSIGELRQQMSLLKATGRDSQSFKKFRLEYVYKLTIPLSSLVLVLCIAPLSLKLGRGGFMGVLAGIIVLFFYWNVFVFSRLFAEAGWLPATLAGWSNVIIFGTAAAFLVWKVE